ncbi:MAG: hypothetical protein AB7K24_15555 [Gemmataceae bacterium]
MKRALILSVLVLAGCQLPPERLPVRPLPEATEPLPYAELLTRARLQATSATEAFFVDQWADLDDYARGLEQTARFMQKSVEVPEPRKKTLEADTKELKDMADQLREAAKAKNVDKTNALLQRIQLKVREMRLAD